MSGRIAGVTSRMARPTVMCRARDVEISSGDVCEAGPEQMVQQRTYNYGLLL